MTLFLSRCMNILTCLLLAKHYFLNCLTRHGGKVLTQV
ncbi:hypothetical protein BCF11_1177 [Collimonas sp. PA-H2]|nr:hypothetical protein BCF11_1177 [Collimonas sp. PA-H2]